MTKVKGRISYEPFLFGLAIIGVVFKVFQTVADRELRFDWTMGVILIIFLVASVLWIINTRQPKNPTSLDISVQTGKIDNSSILGAEASSKDKVRADIRTGDAEKSRITGFREK
jgi:hypothetical protein